MMTRQQIVVGACAAIAAATVLGAALTRERVPEVDLAEAVYAELPGHVEEQTLSFGQTFGQILEDAGLGTAERVSVLDAFRAEAEPRRLRTGTRVRLHWVDERLHGIQVTLDRDRTVHVDCRAGDCAASTITLATTIDTVYAAGAIGSSLWDAVMSLPELAAAPAGDRRNFVLSLDKVFQWQVDFSRQILPGDTYRFVFEREKRPDGSMRTGHLLSAELVNNGKAYHAIWFDPNGDGDGTWYDLDGQSVRRAFLMKPIELSRISSRFGMRHHPILKQWRNHNGVDYAANRGTPVQSTGAGVVVRRNRSGTYGNVIDVRHPNGFLTRYAHLNGFARGISVGSRVSQGEVIGYVGMTGMATGPHLHYEMHAGGRPVDPLAIEFPPEDPVPADNRARWERESAERIALLFSLPGPEEIRSVRADQ
ncbi:MAG: M23 family metallopeptidase [Gemmatimonadetes bacterium]|nr:M23 family metallopeptidase [Gemmatimonadota bacterium]MDE2677559.1 M23 family metallopeptidase [Gemmatimonadota bacterium]MXX35361.1 M23 family metallopeptidase [Gemmatimonadota bacterium]MYD12588.1 M23 family metallopeptidase [Gemmatimonadota bacterium]MYI65753.1 M23 family metallopeptidase [Gemmatimonadota bacterium]